MFLVQFLFLACGPGAGAAPKFSSINSPESLAATVVSENRVRIEWKQTGTDINGFSLERSLDGNNFHEIVQLGVDAREHLEAVLSVQKHYYRIRAFQQRGKHVGYSDYSNVDDATPTASSKPEILDETPPEISLTVPTEGTVISSAQEIRFGADATDDQSVASVEFYMDSEIIGVDASAPYEAVLGISEADNGLHELYAVAYDASGNSGRSSSLHVSVDIVSKTTAEYTTPVLDAVQIQGSDFHLQWSLPESAYGIPSGGYDFFIDGVDTGATHRTDQLSGTISGLTSGEHCFQIQARWLQADPDYVPVSNQVCAQTQNESTPYTDGPLSVFPGAEGYGITTPAGRGGKIIKVTNLNAYGPGSLREAISTSGSRIIVFEVGGIIDLTYNESGGNGSFLYLTEPYVTIAGQTAPSPGITIKGAGLRIKTHDVLIQHLAIRPGDHPSGPRPDARDAIAIRGPSYNVVIDHVSASWGVDENLDTWPEPEVVRDITVSNSIISEGLNRSIHPEGAHSKGFLIGDGSQNVAVIGNLFAHNDFRNPQSKGGVSAAIVNNVVYNPGRYNFMIVSTDRSGLGPNKEAFMGNLFIKGPNTTADIGIAIGNGLESGTAIYHDDNAFADGVTDRPFASVPPLYTIEASNPPVDVSGIFVGVASTMESWVLNYAGSRPRERDVVDRRIVSEVKSRTGLIIDSQNQVGGWPNLSQTNKPFTIPSNPNGDDDGDGYTNIEELLHQRAADLEN